MKLFSILDVKAGFFQKPFSDTSSVNAIRGFTVAVNESGSSLNHFPDDYALMELASFDDNTGSLIPHASPVNLATGRSVVKTSKPQV